MRLGFRDALAAELNFLEPPKREPDVSLGSLCYTSLQPSGHEICQVPYTRDFRLPDVWFRMEHLQGRLVRASNGSIVTRMAVHHCCRPRRRIRCPADDPHLTVLTALLSYTSNKLRSIGGSHEPALEAFL